MRILFLLACIFVARISLAQSTGHLFLEAFKKRWQNAKDYTLKVAELLPAEKYDYKPADEEMNFGEQLLHMAGNISWLSAQYLKNEKNPLQDTKTEGASKEAIIAIIGGAFDYAMNALENFPETQLADTVKFFAGPMTKLQVINLLNDHQAHHRGQLIVYLRLNGIKPPRYVGW